MEHRHTETLLLEICKMKGTVLSYLTYICIATVLSYLTIIVK